MPNKFLLIGGNCDGYIYEPNEGDTLPDKIIMDSNYEYFAHSVGRWLGPHYVYYSDKQKLNPDDNEVELILEKLDKFYSEDGESND